MGAQVINIGPSAHDDERQALQFLAQGLPSSATVFTNPWLMEPSGAVYELDAVVLLNHAIFIVEIKGWRGHLQGDVRDWYLPETRRSPLLLARKTAQVLHTLLSRRSHSAGKMYVQELVFLPNAASFRARNNAVGKRVALRQTLHAQLTNPARLQGLANRRIVPLDPADRNEVESALMTLMRGTPKRPPLRAVAGFTVIDQFDANDRYREVLGEDTTQTRRLLRIYRLPWDASAQELERVRKRATWEAGILRSFERAPAHVRLLQVDNPVETDEGLVVPMEHFEGSTLPGWLAEHGAHMPLASRVALGLRVARTLAWTHASGVVHRQLRPESVLLNGAPDPANPNQPDFRVVGFELAKRTGSTTTVAWASSTAHALENAAPEVVQAISDATPASDQFSLGLLLAFLILRQPLVESTLELIERNRRFPRLRDLDDSLPQRLDDAVARMLQRRTADRFASVDDAVAAVAAALGPDPAPASQPEGLADGALVGADYRIETKLGEGGLSEVYKAKHLLLGQRFAIKVARPTPHAEVALKAEYFALQSIQHPAVVRAYDLTRMVDDRVTLRLDFVPGRTLAATVAGNHLPDIDVAARRRLAEDLLSALDYFEVHQLSHNDLKPDNLMVTPEGRLLLIDFSLARCPAVTEELGESAPRGATFEWRDPAGTTGPVCDRYSAAMCLFYLHAGRHPFNGEVPPPDEAPEIDASELEPAALAGFFAAALHPQPNRRPRTAQALRAAYLQAVGAPVSSDAPDRQPLSADTRLATTSLPSRAVRKLRAAQVQTVGELLALSDDALSRVRGLGSKLQARVARFVDHARAQGVVPTQGAGELHQGPPVFKPLVDVTDPLEALAVSARIHDALRAHGLTTLGQVASLRRTELLGLPGIGAAAATALHKAFVDWQEARDSSARVQTLESLWEAASAPLTARQRQVLRHLYGFDGAPQTQTACGHALGLSQAVVSHTKQAALDALDTRALGPAHSAVDGYVALEYDALPLALAAERLARDLPVADFNADGLVRLLVALDSQSFRLHEAAGEVPFLTRPWVSSSLLRRFRAATAALVAGWPPEPAAQARRTLSLALPQFTGDPLLLAQRLLPTLCTTATGALFEPPVREASALAVVLDTARGPLTLADLQARIDHHFADHGPQLPALHRLPPLLEGTGWVVQGDAVQRADTVAPPPAPPSGDDIRAFLQLEPAMEPRDRVRELLRQAASSGSSFRLLVTPPAHHRAIGHSLVHALGATGVDLAHAWFSRHEARLAMDARAATLPAMRVVTGKRMHQLFDDLVAEHGAPGRTVVVHNTGLLQALGALEQVRLLYDRVQGQARGFWVLAVPGLTLDRQPRFNNRAPVWHQPGLVLPLDEPLRPGP